MTTKIDPMTQARVALICDHPFWATLALRTPLVVDKTCETAWCDGSRLGYNPKFIESLKPAQVKGLLIHELYHKVFLHHLRRGSRDAHKWNIACDFAINGLIKQIPDVDLPPTDCIDPKYDGKSAEEIYELLPAQPQGKGGKGDPGGCGEVRDFDAGQGSREEQEANLKQEIAQAVQVAKERGKLPAGMEIYLDDLLAPQVQWPHVLRRFMTERTREQFSWTKPNRRFISEDLYLPSMISEDAAGEFVFGVDTSGSMLGVLADIMTEVNAVMDDVKPKRSHVVYCDAAVGRVDTYERGEELVVTPNGGGGTDFRPVFEWVAENNIKPKCMIFLTDGYGAFPDHPPPYPVLWVMTENVEPPFGEVINITANYGY
jgi:predicted metal-dependent peptidase